MTTTGQRITAEELLSMPLDEPCELIDGEIVMMTPAGGEHGMVAVRVAARLQMHAENHHLGTVVSAEAGFLITRDPDTVRAPDVAFISRCRLAKLPRGYIPCPPDLAVEVVSPTDRSRDVEAKTQAWLAAGAPLVWVVRPEARTVTVHCPGGLPRTLHEQDAITGEEVLPGFECRVGDFFGG